MPNRLSVVALLAALGSGAVTACGGGGSGSVAATHAPTTVLSSPTSTTRAACDFRGAAAAAVTDAKDSIDIDYRYESRSLYRIYRDFVHDDTVNGADAVVRDLRDFWPQLARQHWIQTLTVRHVRRLRGPCTMPTYLMGLLHGQVTGSVRPPGWRVWS